MFRTNVSATSAELGVWKNTLVHLDLAAGLWRGKKFLLSVH